MLPCPETVRVSRYSTDHTSVYTAPGAATMARGFAVDPSDHRLNTHLVSGPPCGEPAVMLQVEPAIQETAAGAVYVPAGQPAPETLKAAATLLSISTPTRPRREMCRDRLGSVHDHGQRICRASDRSTPTRKLIACARQLRSSCTVATRGIEAHPSR